MQKLTTLLLTLTLTTATSAAFAQNDDQQGAQMNNPPVQSQSAPIERQATSLKVLTPMIRTTSPES